MNFSSKTSTQMITTLQVVSARFLEHVGPSHDDDENLWLGPVKALRGNLSPPGVAPRGVKNHPMALKSIFFKV